jgi:SAM-dependent methyltransferase
MSTVSKFDEETGPIIRQHIHDFIVKTAADLASNTGTLLEVGPQERSTVREYFRNYSIDTFDIVDTYKPTHVGDLTRRNDFIPDAHYDCVVCLEVLEHTLEPFAAVREMRRILKDGGYLLVSAPLNWRIHGPIPDCWRFTEHGFKALLRDFDIVEIDILETPGRELFPLHYNVLARNNRAKQTKDSELNFRFI